MNNPAINNGNRDDGTKKDLPPFTCLIITYNNENEIAGILGDLRLCAPRLVHRVVVIDNDSKDGTVGIVRGQFPEAGVVVNEWNLGYAKAVNQGCGLCATEYILLLNPDIRINDGGLYAALLQALEESPRVAVAGPLQFKVCRGARRINFTWSYWTCKAFLVYLAHLLGVKPPYAAPIPVMYLNAGCLLFRKSAFLRVGMFNEKYFLYGEEPDLFLKLKLYRYECRLLPSSSVVHYREKSLESFFVWRRILFKFKGFCNICDALVVGYARLFCGMLVPGKRE